MYPVMLHVKDQRCLVVGGGGVALRKVEGLLADAASVTVIGLEPIRALVDLAEANRIDLEPRAYRDGEATDYALVFAATDDREANRRVFEDAKSAGVWVNVADDPELCTFHLPARVRRGAFQLAIASAGGAPFVVRRLRQFFERRLGDEWAEWMEAAARFRRGVRDLDPPRPERERMYDKFFAETVADDLKARVPTQAEEDAWLTPRGEPPRHAPAHDAPTHVDADGHMGFVSLIGGGPGDPGLVTVRGRQRMLRADVMVYDRLAITSLPCELPAHVELHGVGKVAGHHPTPQEEINALLVRLAREGKRVARLKGGDPYVFGRGGEEAEALRSAGVPFEVIPCVTAGVAVPAYAGIPVTQRREAVRVTMVTAHEALKSKGPQVRWDLLASDPHLTLLGYMGVTSLPEVVGKLLAAGMDPETPAAMIERGTTASQKVVKSTVAKLPAAIEEGGIHPPALFVIGRTVRYADTLNWFMERPLFGERIGVFNADLELAETLELAGVEVVETPLPITPAGRLVIGAMPLTGWLFADANEVDAVEEERDGPGWDPRIIAWCATDAAAERATMLGWQHVRRVDPSPEAMVATMRARAR